MSCPDHDEIDAPMAELEAAGLVTIGTDAEGLVTIGTDAEATRRGH
jgi:hypothetical protein